MSSCSDAQRGHTEHMLDHLSTILDKAIMIEHQVENDDHEIRYSTMSVVSIILAKEMCLNTTMIEIGQKIVPLCSSRVCLQSSIQ